MFLDRTHAGKKLAQALVGYNGEPVVVYALPRGGVVVGVEVARSLEAPLDLIVVRKIGHPVQPEYAIRAVAEDGYVVTNPNEVATLLADASDSVAGLKRSTLKNTCTFAARTRSDIRLTSPETGPPIEYIAEASMEPAFAARIVTSAINVLVYNVCIVSAEPLDVLLETEPCVLHKPGVAAVPKIAMPLNGSSYSAPYIVWM